ncbi:MAG: TVP38/TMEM64 family protein [Candidatus Hydrogenedentes bacterium]|nr:TVP38/TMEM64 family protein [Candidatus Hydrogenedentota bacterium]
MTQPLPHTEARHASMRIPALAAGLFLCSLLAVAAWSWYTGGIFAVLLDGGASAETKVRALQDFFLAWGPWAPLVYILFVVVEVTVAPIPGAMLYAPGGLLFGGLLGGLYSLIGNVIGAAIAWTLMRVLGETAFGLRFRHALGPYEAPLQRGGFWIVLGLRINPLTSSDLVSYAAGFTGIAAWKVLLATALGMAPQCWLQSYLADALFTLFPQLVYPLVAACALYFAIVVWILVRLQRRPRAANPGN